MPSAEDARLRDLRPPKPSIDPWRPIDTLAERELLADGRIADSWTVFLAGRECPFTCVFCDLWRFTTDERTPRGAIPHQIRTALGSLETSPNVSLRVPPGGRILKLYNASNFFDAGAVPPADDAEIARCVADFDRVVVECHPKLLGRRCETFSHRLRGDLEVAMGFETAHPEAFRRLNKGAQLEDLERASETLRRAGIGLRAFLLLGVPFVAPAEEQEWLQKSVHFALDCGASTVWLIPVRAGSEEFRRLQKSGDFFPPSLDRIEAGFMGCRALAPAAVRLDTWDLDSFADDPKGRDYERLERLRRLQLTPEVTAEDAVDALGAVDVGSGSG